MMSQLHFAIASDAYGINPFKNTKRKLWLSNFSISEIKRHIAVLNEHVFPDSFCSGEGWHHTAWQTDTNNLSNSFLSQQCSHTVQQSVSVNFFPQVISWIYY